MLHGKKRHKSVSSVAHYVVILHRVRLDEEKSKKFAGLVQKNSFLAPHNCTVFVVAWQKAQQNSVNHEKECNKLDLTAAQCF
jgi:hypothetical protein